MRSPLGRLLVVTLFALCASCAGHRAPQSGERSDRSVITKAQLSENRFINAFEAVQSLHSNWLQTRGTDSFQNPSQVWVYLDNTRLGGVETLRQIELTTVMYIRWFDGIAATARWGLDHGSGVIFVSTRS
jgi:hypothetical protein